MLDGVVRQIIDPVLNRMGRKLAGIGLSANTVTVIGALLGCVAAIFIIKELFALAILPLLASRLADGLDGAIARATQRTDFGGYFDIVADFFFYGLIPFAFICANPGQNGLAGAFLILSFYVNGSSFLGYAILAEKRKLQTNARGVKSLYFTGGLLEGTETIVFFVVICLWPQSFVPLAWGFGAVCFLTAFARVLLAAKVFSDAD